MGKDCWKNLNLCQNFQWKSSHLTFTYLHSSVFLLILSWYLPTAGFSSLHSSTQYFLILFPWKLNFFNEVFIHLQKRYLFSIKKRLLYLYPKNKTQTRLKVPKSGQNVLTRSKTHTDPYKEKCSACPVHLLLCICPSSSSMARSSWASVFAQQ